MGDLAAQDDQLLAQYQQLEILRARRPACEEQQSEHLAEGEGDEADGHPGSFAPEIGGVRPGKRSTVMWHPSAAKNPGGEPERM